MQSRSGREVSTATGPPQTGSQGLQTLILNSVWWRSGLSDCEWVTFMFLEQSEVLRRLREVLLVAHDDKGDWVPALSFPPPGFQHLAKGG